MALLGQHRCFLALRSALRHSLATSGIRNEDFACSLTDFVATAGNSSCNAIAGLAQVQRSLFSVAASSSRVSSPSSPDETAYTVPGTAHSAYVRQAAIKHDPASHDKQVALDLLSSLRHSLPAKSNALPEPFQPAQYWKTAGKTASHHDFAIKTSQPVPEHRQTKQTPPPESQASDSMTAAVDHTRQPQPQYSRSNNSLMLLDWSSGGTDHSAKLHKQLGAVLAEAQAQPHWSSNSEGFHACLDNVELLFRLLFFQSENAIKCSVEPTYDNLSQCINNILPVLLIPQQSPAPNITGVMEFLREMLQLSGKATFHCMCQEPAILYLDVYTDLLPMQMYLDRMQWSPADYKHILVRHPQLLLMPLSQLKKNVGYLLGQGLSRQQLLEMWKQRAGLMVEPLKTLHGQMLGLRQAGRPLQDLGLPAALRPDPVYGPVPHPAGLHHMSAGALSPVPSADGKLAQAVSAVVGDPQAVYLFNLRRYQTRALKGVTQNLSGQFIAKARLGGDKVKRLGVYATLHEAARAYDAAVFEHAGKNAKLNYPEEYVSRSAQV